MAVAASCAVFVPSGNCRGSIVRPSRAPASTTRWTLGCTPVRMSAATAAQQGSGRRAGALAGLERHLTVDDDLVVALCPLHPAPLAARQVVLGLADPRRIDGQLLEVVDQHVGRGA